MALITWLLFCLSRAQPVSNLLTLAELFLLDVVLHQWPGHQPGGAHAAGLAAAVWKQHGWVVVWLKLYFINVT